MSQGKKVMMKLKLLTLLLSLNVGAESRYQIAVVDTGIASTYMEHPALCKSGHKDFTGLGLHDVHGHGTNIAGIIAQGIDTTKNCIVVLKYYHDLWMQDAYIGALREIVQKNYLVAVLALSGPDYVRVEKELLKQVPIVVAAAGNNAIDLGVNCLSYPTCYRLENVVSVAASDLLVSNKGGPVRAYEKGANQTGWGVTMSGSSQATANHVVTIINVKDKRK
jgi:subtilisin family serine protease